MPRSATSFSFSEEQEELRRVVRRSLEALSAPAQVRRLMETSAGYDPEVWLRLGQELALTGVHIPEQFGGQGYGFVELAIILEEFGRSLLCAPYFSSIALAANAILNAASEARKKELLPAIASGRCRAALAFTDPRGRWDASGISLEARPEGSGFRLDGITSYVLDGHTAELIVVVARDPGSSGVEGLSFFTVPGSASGLERRLLSTLDATRKQAELRFSGVRAELLGERGSGGAALRETLDLAAIALANESIGAAQKVLETTVEYTKQRVQFGRPIGSFQAIKHRCADLLLEVEFAKSTAYYAAAAAAERSDDLPAVASLAKAYTSDTYMHVAEESIQLHGGVGFTWENDAHLYFKRAKSSEVFLGDPTYHRGLLAERWEI